MNTLNTENRDSDYLPTIGTYLIDRLKDLGLRHMFGIPGDYILSFFKLIEASPIEMVVTTNELCAGYAADAYARVNGIGAACVTYAVGAFSLTNALASAYAEKSPVVIISGSPGLKEQKRNWLLHHTVGAIDTQREIFAKLTVANCVLNDPMTAFREVDRVLNACLRYTRPIYIEIPRDKLQLTPLYNHLPIRDFAISDTNELQESVQEALAMLKSARCPVIIAGVELHRFKLAEPVLAFAEKYRIPIVSTLLSKSVIQEQHPLYLGVYQAAMGRPAITEFVEQCDCVLMLGAMITDVDTGIFTHQLDENRVIFATSEQVKIRYHYYQDVLLQDFIHALAASNLPIYEPANIKDHNPLDQSWVAEKNTAITVRRLFQKINSILGENYAIVADPGDALFGAAELSVHGSAEFLGSAFYATLGWAVPAAIGVQTARRQTRPIVLVGDGAFQMTGMELGTTTKAGLNPIVIVLNNKGYLTERFILEGKFNDIPNWNYHQLPAVIGAGIGFEVRTEEELEEAFAKALQQKSTFALLNVHLASDDYSPALRRLGEHLAKRL